MTTQEIADRYYELAQQGEWMQIQNELHDENVVSQEPEHVALRGQPVITKGREALKAKGDASRQMIETLHSQFCGKPVVGGNFFSLVLKRDVTFKNRPRTQLEEICVFTVNNNKIVAEQFFY